MPEALCACVIMFSMCESFASVSVGVSVCGAGFEIIVCKISALMLCSHFCLSSFMCANKYARLLLNFKQMSQQWWMIAR